MGEAGEGGLGLASLNNFNRHRDIETVPTCLIPGPVALGLVGIGLSVGTVREVVGFGLWIG